MTPSHSALSAPSAQATSNIAGVEERRVRRARPAMGPRCPHCAGPLVFGEGCSLCPICGFSACSA